MSADKLASVAFVDAAEAAPVTARPGFFPSDICRVAVCAFVRTFLPQWDHGNGGDLLPFYAPDATLSQRVLLDANNELSHAMLRRVVRGHLELSEYFASRLKTMHQVDSAVVESSLALDLADGRTLTQFTVSGNGFISSEKTLRKVRFCRSFLCSAASPDKLVIQNDFVEYVIQAPSVESKLPEATSVLLPPAPPPTESICSEPEYATLPTTTKASKKNKKRAHEDETVDDYLAEMETDTYKADSAWIEAQVGEGKKCTSFLNEWCQKRSLSMPQFNDKEASTNSQHPRFDLSVTVGVEEFPVGRGRNKKTAREAAARQALLVLLKRPDTMPDKKAAGATDVAMDVDSAPLVGARTKAILGDAEVKKKNAVSVLQEFFQKKFKESAVYEDQEGFVSNNMPFHVVCVGPCGERFPVGSARTKKVARVHAATLAIDALVNQGRWTFIGTGANAVVPLRKLENKKFKSDVFGLVGKYVHQTFVSIVKAAKDISVVESAKIVAGIVMMDDVNKEAFVVSLATGNRCLKGDLVSTRGEVLNDCHAEILARRGLRRFLFKQCIDYAAYVARTAENKTLFDDTYSPSGKLKIKARYSFHLYINTAPCGDGRVFTLAEPSGSQGSSDPNIHKPLLGDPRKHGVLRSKIERGEGTIPVGEIGTQTLDGISGGERLRTMSCSDKILMWNALGLQGALLSSFMEPVYLSSITIGSLSHHGHISRAVCCRGAGFAAPKPTLAGAAKAELRHPHLGSAQDVAEVAARDCHQKSSPLAINWNFSDQTMEVVDGTEGRLAADRGESRLSKKAMLGLTRSVMEAYGKGPAALADHHYRDVKKMLGFDYVAAKVAFVQNLQNKGYGTWLKRPIEEQMFT